MRETSAILSTELIHEEHTLLDRVRMSVGETDAVFTAFYLPFIRVSAEAVQQLPLSKKIFREARGAFRFSLILAQVALNHAQSRIFFPSAPQEERRLLERQSWYMAFIAAIFSGVALTFSHVHIQSQGKSYHPLLDKASLYNWLKRHPDTLITWRIDEPQLTPKEAAAIAAILVPRGMLAHFDLRVVKSMYSAILPSHDPVQLENTLSQVVREAMHAVLSFYGKEEARRYREKSPHSPEDLSLNVPIEMPGDALTKATTPENPTDKMPSPLEAMSPEVKELFTVFKRHEHYRAMAEKISVTDKGIEVPLQILGSFGLRPVTVFEMLEKSGLVVKKSPNGKAVILVHALKPFLLEA